MSDSELKDTSTNPPSIEKSDDIRYGYSKSNPLLNYRNLKWAYEAYFKNVEMYINDVSRINKFSYELMYDKEIYDVKHRALVEIEDLLVTSPNAVMLLKQFYEETSNLITEAQNIINKSTDIFVDIPTYQSFYDVRQIIIGFNWSIKK